MPQIDSDVLMNDLKMKRDQINNKCTEALKKYNEYAAEMRGVIEAIYVLEGHIDHAKNSKGISTDGT